MKKRLKLAVLLTVILAATGYQAYWSFDPVRHFGQKIHPVTAAPSVPPLSKEGHPQVSSDLANLPSPSAQAAEKQEAFNVLILGLDSKGERTSRSDVIMLAHVIPAKKQANIVSIPRDTRLELPGIGLTKVNHAHAVEEARAGSEAATKAVTQAVSNLMQVPIHYYVKMNFDGFTYFVDAIGGIDVTLPKAISLSSSKTVLPAGEQHLNGSTALAFVRERFSIEDGDFGRQIDQSLLLRAVAQKLLAPDRILALPKLLADTRQRTIESNLSNGELLRLAWLFKGMQGADIHHVLVPGQSVRADDPLVKVKLWYWEPDLSKLREISNTYLEASSAALAP